MSIASISTNPWANPYCTSAIGSAGTRSSAMPGLAWSAAMGSTTGIAGASTGGPIGGSLGSGGSSGLAQMMSDVQSWLLQMQSERNANAATGAASGRPSGTTTSAGTTTDAGNISDVDGHHHGHYGEQGMALLRNIGQRLQTIESTLAGPGSSGAPQPSATARLNAAA
jgi:hypothetical protein